jgi:hypothetical protein
MKHTATKIGALALAGVLLVSCSGGSGTDGSGAVAPSTSVAPAFEAKQVDQVKVSNISAPQVDPGLNIEVTLQAANSNPAASGSIIYVLVKNLNEMPLPTDALNVSLQGASAVSDGTVGLDLPLGPSASTNLQFAFDASYSDLYNGTFTIGNLVYEGNLAGV